MQELQVRQQGELLAASDKALTYGVLVESKVALRDIEDPKMRAAKCIVSFNLISEIYGYKQPSENVISAITRTFLHHPKYGRFSTSQIFKAFDYAMKTGEDLESYGSPFNIKIIHKALQAYSKKLKTQEAIERERKFNEEIKKKDVVPMPEQIRKDLQKLDDRMSGKHVTLDDYLKSKGHSVSQFNASKQGSEKRKEIYKISYEYYEKHRSTVTLTTIKSTLGISLTALTENFTKIRNHAK